MNEIPSAAHSDTITDPVVPASPNSPTDLPPPLVAVLDSELGDARFVDEDDAWDRFIAAGDEFVEPDPFLAEEIQPGCIDDVAPDQGAAAGGADAVADTSASADGHDDDLLALATALVASRPTRPAERGPASPTTATGSSATAPAKPATTQSFHSAPLPFEPPRAPGLDARPRRAAAVIPTWVLPVAVAVVLTLLVVFALKGRADAAGMDEPAKGPIAPASADRPNTTATPRPAPPATTPGTVVPTVQPDPRSAFMWTMFATGLTDAQATCAADKVEATIGWAGLAEGAMDPGRPQQLSKLVRECVVPTGT